MKTQSWWLDSSNISNRIYKIHQMTRIIGLWSMVVTSMILWLVSFANRDSRADIILVGGSTFTSSWVNLVQTLESIDQAKLDPSQPDQISILIPWMRWATGCHLMRMVKNLESGVPGNITESNLSSLDLWISGSLLSTKTQELFGSVSALRLAVLYFPIPPSQTKWIWSERNRGGLGSRVSNSAII